jgi:membrane protease YdiL (CAAX protease family)
VTGPVPQSRHLLKAIGWSIAFLLIGIALTTLLLVLVWAAAGRGDVQRGLALAEGAGTVQTLGGGLCQLVGFGLATWLIGVRRLGLDRRDLRLPPARAGVRGLLAGLGVGAFTAGLALAAAVAAGSAYWSRDAGSPADYIVQVAKTTAALAPAALSEEVMFRGVPLVLVAAAAGRGTALLVVSGVIFSLFHIQNPDVTGLALGNIALAGLFLGVAFYAPGGLWTAFGAHLGWNATLAALDAPVSGLPVRIPLLDYHAGEPAWMSGGPFGPEGGLAATLALALAIAFTARWVRKEPA